MIRRKPEIHLKLCRGSNRSTRSPARCSKCYSEGHQTMPASGPSSLLRIVAFSLALLVPAALNGQHASPSQLKASSPAEREDLAKAESLMQRGQLAEAKASVEDFLQSHSRSIDGHNLLGIICSDQQNYACSLDAFQQALILDPASARTHTNLGNLYASAGKADSAEKEFRSALKLAPSD